MRKIVLALAAVAAVGLALPIVSVPAQAEKVVIVKKRNHDHWWHRHHHHHRDRVIVR
jgi:ABC-type sugar transport system substrate-binding protein